MIEHNYSYLKQYWKFFINRISQLELKTRSFEIQALKRKAFY
jgi:hypothetical protein